MKIQKLVSLAELSLELGVNKSRLNYYYYRGLLPCVSRVGNFNVFDGQETTKRFKKINELKEKGNTLLEIKKLLN